MSRYTPYESSVFRDLKVEGLERRVQELGDKLRQRQRRVEELEDKLRRHRQRDSIAIKSLEDIVENAGSAADRIAAAQVLLQHGH